MSSDVIGNSEIENASRKPFWRQTFVCTGLWTSYFMLGLGLGSPTVLIPQIRKEANSTDVISDEMASWLSSVYGFASLPWVIILPFLVHVIGRKTTFILTCINTCIGFIVFYYSTSPTQILISEIINGVITASNVTTIIMIVSEYTSPRYRGVFFTIKSSTMYWGIWASNAIGTFTHWKNIGIVAIICACYSLFNVIFWPESPFWLATKGRFEECAAAHRWLKGTDPQSEKELENLIYSQKEYLSSCRKQRSTIRDYMINFFDVIRTKEYYKSISLSFLVMSLYFLSGKLVCNIYAIDIIKKITNDEYTAYMGMLILDGITVLGMYTGCILSKFFKRRPLLLTFSSIGVTSLFVISLYLYLIKLSIIYENAVLSISFLVIFSLSISCGPIIMSSLLHGEMAPLKFRSFSVCIIALYAKLIMAVMLKIAPFLFKRIGLHGAFLFYGICCSICIVLLYRYLPETKDKTLHEIAESMKGKPREQVVELVPFNPNPVITPNIVYTSENTSS